MFHRVLQRKKQILYEMKINFILILLATLVSMDVAGQVRTQQQRPSGSGMNAGRMYGKVVDAATGKPVEAASIQLSQNKMDTTDHKMKEMVVAAGLTDKRGEFSIDKLSVMGKFNLLISAVGFDPIIEEVKFDLKMGNDMSQMMNAIDKDLGNFKMKQAAKELEGIVITGNKSLLQMNIDRKVFNVDKDISSAGGTAVDVMKNVPSVMVDIDGNVTLRNKAPQIFVDGRPTTMTLDQIPAEQIESVEIITNPSAKFDASGGGAGILNIVLKKNRKAGYNGNIRTNVDTKESYGLGGDFNVKQGKVNFFANGMYNQRNSNGEQITNRLDNVNDLQTIFSQKGNSDNGGHFAFARAGLDFLADNRNTYSISGTYVNGKFNNNGILNLSRDTVMNNYQSSESGQVNTNSSFNFKNLGGALSYKHNFAKPNKNITADLNYNESRNSNNSFAGTQYFDGLGSPKFQEGKQTTQGSGENSMFTAQTDYTNPINDNVKIEAGLRGAVRNYSSENNNFLFDYGSGKYEPIPSMNSRYKFKDQVYAGYMTYSQKINNFSFQLGGRIESSFYSGKLVDSNQTFSNKYPFSFFPSVFLTQKINDQQDIQLNYSRKINRPNFFQLIPYYDFSDSLNISRGNPGLKPEFTNLFELSYQVNMKKGNNILATLYYRNTNDLITRYQFRTLNPNPSNQDSIFISTFENANSSNAYGLEVTSMNRISKWWNLTTNVNFYNSSINGSNLESDLSNSQLSWFGKINSTFTLPSNFSIELTGDYTSKTILPPARGGGGGGRMWGAPLSTANGYSDPNYGFDIAIKKEFLKDRSASITLGMNDIFATRKYTTHSRSDYSKDIYSIQDSRNFRDAQIVKLSLNWRFGKFDASLFKRKNMKGQQEGMQDSMQGMQQ